MIDRVAYVDIAIHGSFGFHVTHGREACIEIALDVQSRKDGSVLVGILQQIFFVMRVVGVGKHDVGVAIDQAGKDGRLRKIHNFGPGGNRLLAGWADAIDALAANNDDLIVKKLSGTNVEQLARPNILRRRGSRLLGDGDRAGEGSGLRDYGLGRKRACSEEECDYASLHEGGHDVSGGDFEGARIVAQPVAYMLHEGGRRARTPVASLGVITSRAPPSLQSSPAGRGMRIRASRRTGS